MKTKKEIERALEGAVHEVVDLAAQLEVDAITLYAKADGFGNACAWERDNTDRPLASVTIYSKED